ncbi:hypothetical protein BGW80DRAFT_1254165 [Lactifluus volemus]|nr:hypothetical protein BGW80DRAFT_1254165 [Lactifluus volemus]
MWYYYQISEVTAFADTATAGTEMYSEISVGIDYGDCRSRLIVFRRQSLFTDSPLQVFKCLSHLSYEFSPEIAYFFTTLYGIRPLEEAIQHLLVSALPRIRGAVGVDIVKADTALRVGYAAAGEFEGWLGASSIFICLTLAESVPYEWNQGPNVMIPGNRRGPRATEEGMPLTACSVKHSLNFKSRPHAQLRPVELSTLTMCGFNSIYAGVITLVDVDEVKSGIWVELTEFKSIRDAKVRRGVGEEHSRQKSVICSENPVTCWKEVAEQDYTREGHRWTGPDP